MFFIIIKNISSFKWYTVCQIPLSKTKSIGTLVSKSSPSPPAVILRLRVKSIKSKICKILLRFLTLYFFNIVSMNVYEKNGFLYITMAIAPPSDGVVNLKIIFSNLFWSISLPRFFSNTPELLVPEIWYLVTLIESPGKIIGFIFMKKRISYCL